MTSAGHQNFACNLRKGGGGGDWRGYYSSNVLVRERGRLCETPTQYVDFRGINVTPIEKLKSLPHSDENMRICTCLNLTISATKNQNGFRLCTMAAWMYKISEQDPDYLFTRHIFAISSKNQTQFQTLMFKSHIQSQIKLKLLTKHTLWICTHKPVVLHHHPPPPPPLLFLLHFFSALVLIIYLTVTQTVEAQKWQLIVKHKRDEETTSSVPAVFYVAWGMAAAEGPKWVTQLAQDMCWVRVSTCKHLVGKCQPLVSN